MKTRNVLSYLAMFSLVLGISATSLEAKMTQEQRDAKKAQQAELKAQKKEAQKAAKKAARKAAKEAAKAQAAAAPETSDPDALPSADDPVAVAEPEVSAPEVPQLRDHSETAERPQPSERVKTAALPQQVSRVAPNLVIKAKANLPSRFPATAAIQKTDSISKPVPCVDCLDIQYSESTGGGVGIQ